ncbi:4'-phosphopantetheinyl transferase [Aeromonas sp. 1805]|uniref:restriction endonuclease subunit S n=1 Tax=Aeromonas sp. 1805 TaxID=2560028 RepID=UPI00148B300B|nr:restriction endonuclease subunit S [Aeromonas sp. 1805]QJT19949.1 4'-phosphopantetheinyl transferase [Aeromonas sp. 1805]
MISFPAEWVETTLDNIADWGSGGTPSRKNEDYYGGDIPWVKTGDLGEKIIKKPSEYITELGLKNSSAKLFPKGAVAIAMYGATIGKASILGIDATTNQACAVGNPKPNVTTSEFLYYFLLNEKDVFVAKGKGGAQPNISQGLIKEHVVYLPPVAEQKEIVDRLDILLAQVEATQARLARIPDIIKQFRQSVLAAAVSGKLTKEWIGISTSKRTYLTLNDVGIEVKTGPFGSALHKSDYLTGGIPIINPMHISEGKITPSLNMSISKEKFEELAAWQLRKNDVIIGRRGEMGRAAVVNTDGHLLCGTGSMILRVTDNALPKYLEIILRSPVAVDYFNSSSVGSTMVNLNQKIIKNLKVYFPEIEEQTEIVRRVEKLFAYADTLEQQAKAAKARVDNLTQAILAKAFRGELTADWRAANPDLISGDHSAAALLARIQTERATVKPRKRASKPAISPTSSGVPQ